MKLHKQYVLLYCWWLLVVILSYHRVYSLHFQGDEWVGAGSNYALLYGQNPITDITYKLLGTFRSLTAHATPLAGFIGILKYRLFGMNFPIQVSVNMLIHSGNALLMAMIAWRLTRHRIGAFFAGLYVAIAYISWNAVIWISALPTLLATFFVQLTVLFLMDYLNGKRSQKWYLICYGMALLTKEIALVLVVLVPLLSVHTIGIKKKTVRLLKGFIFVSCSYAFIRVSGSFFYRAYSRFFLDVGSGNDAAIIDIPLIIFRSVVYPIKMLPQLFISNNTIMRVVEFLVPYSYPHLAAEQEIRGINFLQYVQTAGSDMILYVLFVVFVVGLFLLFRRSQEARDMLLLRVSGVIILFSSLLLIAVGFHFPSFAFVTFFDARHLYLPMIAGGLLLAYGIKHLIQYACGKPLAVLSCVLISIIGVQYSIGILNEKIDGMYTVTRDRGAILSTIAKSYDPTADRTVIYVQSDTPYYGFAQSMLPFQVSAGHVILTHLAYLRLDPPIDPAFLSDTYLRAEFFSEGYAEKQGKGFGFYQTEAAFQHDLALGLFTLDDVLAFTWEGASHIFTDNSAYFKQQYIAQQEELEIAEEQIKGWSIYERTVPGTFSFLYPPDMGVRERTPSNPWVSERYIVSGSKFELDVEIMPLPSGYGFYDVIDSMTDADGKLLSENERSIDVNMFEIHPQKKNTVFSATSGSLPKYFISIAPDVIVIVTVKRYTENNTGDIERVLATMIYEEAK